GNSLGIGTNNGYTFNAELKKSKKEIKKNNDSEESPIKKCKDITNSRKQGDSIFPFSSHHA
ncbi:2980_t:CDS:2, partial [Dentiscutata erythropus]